MLKVDKYLALHSEFSRRKAKELIELKCVTVNGVPANFSTKVKEGDEVMVNDQLIIAKKISEILIAYHKPKGVVCTTERIQGNIVDAIGFKEKIYPIGRLDKDSEGLILLTNRGELIDKISNPLYMHEKEYEVTLNLPVRKKFLEEISRGVVLNDEETLPCTANMVAGTKRVFRVVLKQGMNRQIRRMCNLYNYQVIKLLRIRVMNIELGKLKCGEWRDLSTNEKKTLAEML